MWRPMPRHKSTRPSASITLTQTLTHESEEIEYLTIMCIPITYISELLFLMDDLNVYRENRTPGKPSNHDTIGQWINQNLFLCPMLNEVEGGKLVSPCPSVPVHLWTESCPLCIFYNTLWIHFICTYFIKQLQKVCLVSSFFFFFSKFKYLKFWQIL